MYQIVIEKDTAMTLGGVKVQIERRQLHARTVSGETVSFDGETRIAVWVASSNQGDVRLWATAVARTPGFPFPKEHYYQIRAGNPAADFLSIDELKRRTTSTPEPRRMWYAPSDTLIPAEMRHIEFAATMRRPKDMKAHIRLPERGYVSAGDFALVDGLTAMDDLAVARSPSTAGSRSVMVRVARALFEAGIDVPEALATSLRMRVQARPRVPTQPGRTICIRVRPGSRVLVVAEHTPSFAMAASA